jgi:hypothetical protein
VILASLVLAATGGLNFPPPGDYRYTAAMSGQNVGSWTVSVTRNAADTEVDETSSASVMGMQLSATAALTLGADLAPTKYSGSYRTPTQALTVSAELTPASATVVDAVTSRPKQVALAANTRHFVVIEPGLLAGLFALPAQLDSWKDPGVTWITPATGQTQSLTTNAQAPLTRPAGVPAADAVLSIDRPIAVTIWYDPATYAPDEISVPSQSAVLTRVK